MKNMNFYLTIFLTFVFVLFSGCAAEMTSMKIERSLPQRKLAYYNDNFDSMREDLWSKAALVFTEDQLSNFKLADITIKNGRLKIKTKRKCFSKGAYAFKHALRGDFDIQVDCHIEFLNDTIGMDQILAFVVHEKGREHKTFNSAIAQAIKTPGLPRGRILALQINSGRVYPGNPHTLDRFTGTFRIVRKSNNAYVLCRLSGSEKWMELDSFRFSTEDVLFGVLLQNFTTKRASIKAESSITAFFDNFKINAAQEIVEEDI
jgi:hypothetical protein